MLSCLLLISSLTLPEGHEGFFSDLIPIHTSSFCDSRGTLYWISFMTRTLCSCTLGTVCSLSLLEFSPLSGRERSCLVGIIFKRSHTVIPSVSPGPMENIVQPHLVTRSWLLAPMAFLSPYLTLSCVYSSQPPGFSLLRVGSSHLMYLSVPEFLQIWET